MQQAKEERAEAAAKIAESELRNVNKGRGENEEIRSKEHGFIGTLLKSAKNRDI